MRTGGVEADWSGQFRSLSQPRDNRRMDHRARQMDDWDSTLHLWSL